MHSHFNRYLRRFQIAAALLMCATAAFPGVTAAQGTSTPVAAGSGSSSGANAQAIHHNGIQSQAIAAASAVATTGSAASPTATATSVDSTTLTGALASAGTPSTGPTQATSNSNGLAAPNNNGIVQPSGAMTGGVGTPTPAATAPATQGTPSVGTRTATAVATKTGQARASLGAEADTVSAAAATVIRINSGGGGYTDSSGQFWAGDSNFSGGSTASTGAGIGGTGDSGLYQNLRYGNFTYDLPVANGPYTVNLKFAEWYWNNPGQRVFDVQIEGLHVLTNFDVLAQAGKNNALDRSFTTNVSDGSLTIQFISRVNYAMVAAIEVIGGNDATRVNAGGGGYTDSSGQFWAGDSNFSGGSTASTGAGIGGTSDSSLYQSVRYGNFTYQFPVANGPYTVNLKFAEWYWNNPGQRVFDVQIEGQTVLSSFDVLAQAGKNNALDRSFTTNVSDGSLTIQFISRVNFAMVSAIEIFAGGSPAPPPPPPPAPPPPDPGPPPTSLQSLVDGASAGSTVSVPPGIYRETVRITKPLTLIAVPGAEIRGSDVWTGWNSAGGRWVSQLSVPSFPPIQAEACNGGRCAWPEQVFIDGYPLTQVATNPNPGEFALDGGRHVVLADDPNGRQVEVTTRQNWILGQASNVTIAGFTMQHAASGALDGGINVGSSTNGWTIQDNHLFHAHGGVLWGGRGSGHRILRNEIAFGGGMGIIDVGNNALVQGNDIHDNGAEGFNCTFGCAGLKATQKFMTVDGNDVHNNFGAGIHLDFNADNATITNNRVHDNWGMGIFFEVSTGARITDNVVWRNGSLEQGWAWGAGIVISSSANAEVARNVLAWNVNGITVASQPRYDTPPAGVTGNWVHDNVIAHRDPPAGFYAYAQAWVQENPGIMYNASSNNHGENNAFWSPTGEGAIRYNWGNPMTRLSDFANTPGGTGARYMSAGEKDQILNSRGVPTLP